MTHPNPTQGVGRGFRIGGAVLVSVAAILLVLWLSSRATDRHGAIFLLGGGVVFGLAGAWLWTIGYSLSIGARRRG
jgi:hypothetical protein